MIRRNRQYRFAQRGQVALEYTLAALMVVIVAGSAFWVFHQSFAHSSLYGGQKSWLQGDDGSLILEEDMAFGLESTLALPIP